MLTVTYHGGNLLTHVEVQALYLGSDWAKKPIYYQQTGSLENFLETTVNSTYLDALTNAGYGVGRGTFSPGKIDPMVINKGSTLTDKAIRKELQADIQKGGLQAPDSNRLYIVFVEDNVAVKSDQGQSSKRFLQGYHTAFAGTDASGQPVDIRYAVVTYPGGSVGNSAIHSLSASDSQTVVASHELAEAVTDPDVNYRAAGWYDDQLKGEIADITEGQPAVYLNGYAVQEVADQNDLPITPAGATF
jgi:hypothetical protein